MAVFILKVIAIIIISYLIGNLNWADILSKKKGIDIRKQGSGNPGTMNMFRTFGFKVAILTLILDALKGAVPTIVAYYIMQFGSSYGTTVLDSAPPILGYYSLGVGKLAMLLAGLSAILGHVFPVFKKFKGGKGVGTSIGVFFALNPLIMLLVFVCALTYLFFGKYGSVASFICVISMAVIETSLAAVFDDSVFVMILVNAIMILILWAHRKNIVRLWKGTESSSNIIQKLKDNKKKKVLAQASDNSENVVENVKTDSVNSEASVDDAPIKNMNEAQQEEAH